ncbi:hypothetical protein LXL04_023358 [Taraxacum kok-saghyz]
MSIHFSTVAACIFSRLLLFFVSAPPFKLEVAFFLLCTHDVVLFLPLVGALCSPHAASLSLPLLPLICAAVFPLCERIEHPADVKKQTVFFLQTADVWSTSSTAEGCRCGPQTADVLASKQQKHLIFLLLFDAGFAGGVASPSPSPSLSLSTRQVSLTTPSPHAVVVAVAKGDSFFTLTSDQTFNFQPPLLYVATAVASTTLLEASIEDKRALLLPTPEKIGENVVVFVFWKNVSNAEYEGKKKMVTKLSE